MVLFLWQIFKVILNIKNIKKNETLTTITPIRVCMNRINNRSVFKIKYGYWLELKEKRETKNAENVASIEVVEVVLVHCS